MELNGSSYYRSNPFHNQGGLPNSAFRNRLPPSSVAEVPQGNSYFEPTHKKHFQRLGYYSTIGEENLINNSQVRESSRGGENPSSRGGALSIEDIEGATTNTLISKAVKNRLKAQQELNRRKLQSAHEHESSYQSQKPQLMQKQALQRMKAAPQPNYHTLVKNLKTEESQASPEKQSKQPYALELNRGGKQLRPAVTQNLVPNQGTKRNQQYEKQLHSTQDEIRRLQQELKVLKESREKSKSQWEAQPPQQPPQLEYSHQQHPRLSQPRYSAPQYQKGQQYNEQPYSQDYGQPHSYNPVPSIPSNYSQPRMNQHHLQAPLQPKPSSPIQQYHDAYPPNPEPPYLQKPSTPHQPYQPQHPPHQPYNQIPQPHHPQHLPLEQSRQQHRRFNPTFLSYGSQPIGIAGKNIVAS